MSGRMQVLRGWESRGGSRTAANGVSGVGGEGSDQVQAKTDDLTSYRRDLVTGQGKPEYFSTVLFQ